MPEARLATGIWAAAYLARLRLADIPAYVIAHGDDTAGAVLVKCALLDGTARLCAREWDLETGTRCWAQLMDGAEPDVDAAIARRRATDPDLWVIEIESPRAITLLDQDGLSEG